MKTRPFYLFGVTLLAAAGLLIVLTTLSAGASAAPAMAGYWKDDFSGPPLDSRWTILQEDPTLWSLTQEPGWMFITTTQGKIQDGLKIANLITTDAPQNSNYEIRAKFTFSPTINVQSAGLVLMHDDKNLLQLVYAYCLFASPSCPGRVAYFDYIKDGQTAGEVNYAVFIPKASIPHYLRVSRQAGSSGGVYTFTAFVSPDNSAWTLIGSYALTESLPTRVGFAAYHNPINIGDPITTTARFDYFEMYQDDLPPTPQPTPTKLPPGWNPLYLPAVTRDRLPGR